MQRCRRTRGPWAGYAPLTLRFDALGFVEALDRDTLQRLGVRDAQEALPFFVGLTPTTARGLTAPYTRVLLNGAQMPTSNQDFERLACG